jgi:glycosyltransferase involved in cell wall biosynthesis
MNVTCLVKRWPHHTTSGGYDRLASAIGSTVVKRNVSNGIASRITKKIWWRRTNTRAYLLDYQFDDWLAEQRLLIKCLVKPPDVVHVLYGDEQLDLLLRRRRMLRCPLVATFHLPGKQVIRRFEDFQSEETKGVDAAIVLARNEVENFQRWFGADKVVYIPHGIDTTRFRPDDRKTGSDKLRLLIVGDHMRDWEVMHRVIDEARYSNLDIRFDVVTRPEYFAYFTGCSNVTFYSQIPEPELIGLYQAADALFLPVKGATANNAVLEALACGTPVITTAVGGMPDYVTGDCGWLTPPGDTGSMVELIKRLCVDRELVLSRREKARGQALKFDWQRVAEWISVVYSAVQTGRPPSAAARAFEKAAF